MSIREIDSVIKAQREYFATGRTLPVAFRRDMLTRLYNYIKSHEVEIADALKADLGKGAYESFMCEIGMVLSEITYMKKNLARLVGKRRVRTPLAQFASESYKLASPYGCVLIISPWNYPFLLTLDPLVDAIAAGNCAILKPSAYAPACAEMIVKLVSECFAPEYVSVVTGGRRENAELLSKKFDLVFFTGSKEVGREVLRRCAENLTPAVLELGGKSPCIVDKTANIRLSARRIVFGKFLNCGQTCVAPDYILCDRSVKDSLVSAIIKEIEKQYGQDPLSNPDYGKIVNEKHFERILSLIDIGKVVYGGCCDRDGMRICPTVMDNVTWDDAVMGEEIFGPVLPILSFDDISEVIPMLAPREKPLAQYVFSESRENIKLLTERLQFGGGCINDVVIHLATEEMGFGGVGESGMGSYHGEEGFRAFSHIKSIVDKKTIIDLPMRYQPYKNRLYEKLLHLFLK